MNWTKLADSRIEEAIARGEFEDLPGKGQPLDLAEYFAQPAAERAGSSLLKNANVIPPEVQLLRDIAGLEEAILTAEGAQKSERVAEGKESAASSSLRTSAVSNTPLPHPHHAGLAKLREQLQEKRVAFALAMERRRRRESPGVD